MSEPLSFLSLPPEIRFQVYSYCTLIQAPISTYDGLFLSCKSINDEYPKEAIHTMNAFIDQAEEDLKANKLVADITRPTCFHNKNAGGIGKLVFSYHPVDYPNEVAILKTLAPLLSCSFDRVFLKVTDAGHWEYTPSCNMNGWDQYFASAVMEGKHTVRRYHFKPASGVCNESRLGYGFVPELRPCFGRLR